MSSFQIPTKAEAIYFDGLPPIFKLIGWIMFGLIAVGLVVLMAYGGGQYAVVALRAWPYPTGAIALILLARTISQRSALTVPLALVLAVCVFATMVSPWTIAEGIKPQGPIIALSFIAVTFEVLIVLAFIYLTIVFWRQGKLGS